MTKTIDLRGVVCPTNYVRARLALEQLASGEEIEVLLDAGEPVRNVSRSVRDDGDTVVAVREVGGAYAVLIRKGGNL